MMWQEKEQRHFSLISFDALYSALHLPQFSLCPHFDSLANTTIPSPIARQASKQPLP